MMFPAFFVQKIRGSAASFISRFAVSKSYKETHRELYQKLELENHSLRSELAKLSLLIETNVIEGTRKESLKKSDVDSRFLSYAIPAKVIFRDPESWSSSFWIDVGHNTNEKNGNQRIAKNSPVVIGKSVIGAIDYVGKKQSRVRLISDSGLTPSVRVVRGNIQHQFFLEHVEILIRALSFRGEIGLNTEEKGVSLKLLEKIKEYLLAHEGQTYLAKGILQGRGAPLWRRSSQILQGIGFNYDFDDEEGPARDLMTGKPLDPNVVLPGIPLIKEGDLLVTTGMDGVFPAGLRVAEVIHVYPLKEGAYSYSLEAIPLATALHSLQFVFVLPPLGFDFEDHP